MSSGIDSLRALVGSSIIRRYAVLEDGAPARCPLTRLAKVIFPSQTAAALCRDAMATVFGQEARHVYQCRAGHWHLSKQEHPS